MSGLNYDFFLHHNIVYSKSPVYNNLNDPGAHIKCHCFTSISLFHLKHIAYSFVLTFHHKIHVLMFNGRLMFI
jgi:hypothetical protein